MALAVGVVFSPGGKVYSFDPNGLDLHWNEYVICQTSRGLEHGRVVQAKRDHDETTGRRCARSCAAPPRVTPRRSRRTRPPRPRPCAPSRPRCEGDGGTGARAVAAEVVFDGSRVVLSFRAEERIELKHLAAEPAEGDRPAGRAPAGEPARGGPGVRSRRAVRGAQVLQPLPVARAADHAAHGQGPGPADEPGPDHRPVRTAPLLPGLRAPRLPLVPRPRAGRRPPGRDARKAAASCAPTRCSRTR